MEFKYFKDSDMLYFKLADGVSTESEEVAPNIVLDYNARGQVIGIELEDASKLVELSSFNITALPITSFAFNRATVRA